MTTPSPLLPARLRRQCDPAQSPFASTTAGKEEGWDEGLGEVSHAD